MSYIINGPVIVGDASQNTEIRGNIFTPNLTTTAGDLIYCSTTGTGALTRLAATTNGFVLTLSGGLPVWAAAAAGGVTDVGFSALKSGTQAVAAGIGATTTSQITGWVTSSPGYNGTGSPFSVAGSQFVVPTTGTYLLNANISFSDSNNSGSRGIDVFNATTATVLFQRVFQPTPDITINQQATISAQMSLTATHNIQIRLTVTAGASAVTSTIQSASNSTFWSMTRLS